MMSANVQATIVSAFISLKADVHGTSSNYSHLAQEKNICYNYAINVGHKAA